MDYTNLKKVLSENIRRYISVPTSSFEQNDVIFQKGDAGTAMYEVVSGSIAIYIHYGEPAQQLLAVKNAGDYFGEIALLENRPRTATAVSMGHSELRKISSSTGFLYYICQNPEKLESIMNGMSERFKIARNDYLSACETLLRYKECKEADILLDEELEKSVKHLTDEAEKQRRKK